MAPLNNIRNSLICTVISCVVLFLGFQYNYWGAADEQLFQNEKYAIDALLLGRLVQSRQEGVFSHSGFLGTGVPDDADNSEISFFENISNQHATYINGGRFKYYFSYLSQPAVQSMAWSLLDRIVPGSHEAKLENFYRLSSLLSAIVLALVTAWFYAEFGILTALFVLVSLGASQWLAGFSRSLIWSMWAFYIPMCSVMIYLRRISETRRKLTDHMLSIGLVIYLTLLIKFFMNGFEFITTAIAMILAPLVYYAAKSQANPGCWLRLTVTYFISTTLAVVSSLLILVLQIASYKGGLSDGIGHIQESFGKRTHGNSAAYHEAYSASLESGIPEVLLIYLKIVYVDLGNYFISGSDFVVNRLFKVEYHDLLGLLVVSSLLLLLLSRKQIGGEERVKNYSLILAAWCALLGPVSWFVIFKGHSYIHPFINPIIWQMPFTLFAFAVAGKCIATLFIKPDP